jgi:hypothetical protein
MYLGGTCRFGWGGDSGCRSSAMSSATADVATLPPAVAASNRATRYRTRNRKVLR